MAQARKSTAKRGGKSKRAGKAPAKRAISRVRKAPTNKPSARKPKARGRSGTKKTALRAAQPAVQCTMYVCRSCVWSEAQREREGKRHGTFLLEAIRERIAATPLPPNVSLRGVFCLNGCRSPCNVAFRAPGKEGLRFSRLTPENAADVLAFAEIYLASKDGAVMHAGTPEPMRGKVTARTPAPPLR